MDQYLLIPFLEGWTSINPSYFDVNKKGVLLVLTHCHMGVSENRVPLNPMVDDHYPY